jgi:hypothetical protein
VFEYQGMPVGDPPQLMLDKFVDIVLDITCLDVVQNEWISS